MRRFYCQRSSSARSRSVASDPTQIASQQAQPLQNCLLLAAAAVADSAGALTVAPGPPAGDVDFPESRINEKSGMPRVEMLFLHKFRDYCSHSFMPRYSSSLVRWMRSCCSNWLQWRCCILLYRCSCFVSAHTAWSFPLLTVCRSKRAGPAGPPPVPRVGTLVSPERPRGRGLAHSGAGHLLPDKFPRFSQIAPHYTGSNALMPLYSYGFVTINFGRINDIVTVRGMLADEWVHVVFS